MIQSTLRMLAALCLSVTGCQSIPVLEGNGQAGQKSIDLDRPITAVHISDGLTADLLQLSSGGLQEATISGDDNLLSELEVTQHEGHLSIRMRPGVLIRTKVGFKLLASLPFDAVSLSDSSSAHLRLSGRFLNLSLADSSSASAVGRLGSLELEATDSSRFDFSQCPVREASIRMNDASRGIAEVRSRIRQLELLDASHLDLLGTPKIDQQLVKDGSEVIQLGQGT
jgi:hypothetical protein